MKTHAQFYSKPCNSKQSQSLRLASFANSTPARPSSQQLIPLTLNTIQRNLWSITSIFHLLYFPALISSIFYLTFPTKPQISNSPPISLISTQQQRQQRKDHMKCKQKMTHKTLFFHLECWQSTLAMRESTFNQFSPKQQEKDSVKNTKACAHWVSVARPSQLLQDNSSHSSDSVKPLPK